MSHVRVIFDCPLPPWAVASLGAALLAAVVVLVARDTTGLTRRARVAVLSLAAVTTLMLTALALGPKFIRTWLDPQKPTCLILADGSRSMLLSDGYTDAEAKWIRERLKKESEAGPLEVPRQEVVRLLLDGGPDGWLAALRKDFDLRGCRFASKGADLLLNAGPSRFEADPEGYSTALGDVMESAFGGVNGPNGSRPRAVVLISDGAWNAGRDPSEVARMLGKLGTPVYAVGVGNPNPPRDVAVVAVRAPGSVLLGDEVFLTAEVAATGLGALRVPVQLMEEGNLVEEKQVVTLPSGRPVNVRFSFVTDKPGTRNLAVRVPKQELEQDESNNEAAATVEVVERKINALLVEAEPRWEFRFIRNVLERDPAVSLTVCLLRPGVGPIAGAGYLGALPTEKKDLAAYDLVVLGDVPREALTDAFQAALADKVKSGAGALVVVAGRRSHYRELAGTPLEEILPVTLDRAFGDGKGGTPFQPELTQEGASHLITRLAGTTEDTELEWSKLPPVNWSADVSALARGATALLVHPYRVAGTSKMPLLAVHRVGAGKVMFCGIEETWRWRKSVGDKYHYRFWAQTVRWMVKRPFAEGDPRARLSTDRVECCVGEKVEVEAYCLGPDGFPLENAQVWLNVTQRNGSGTPDDVKGPGPISLERLVMEPAPGGWGVYRATLTATRPGKIRMQPTVSVYGPEPLSSSASIDVSRLDLERNFLAQDRDALTAIAQASGGKYLRLDEVGALTKMLAANIERQPLVAEYSPCRHWAFYTVLALLLGSAWFIRKRSGLA